MHGWPAAVERPPPAVLTVPTFLPVFACGMAAAVLAHLRVPSRGLSRGLVISGAVLVCVDAWWHHRAPA